MFVVPFLWKSVSDHYNSDTVLEFLRNIFFLW